MGWRSVVALAAVTAVAAPLRADDVNEPYRVEVVLQFGAHRLLTKEFRERLKQEVHDDLQASLGKRDSVKVDELKLDDGAPAMWKRVAAEGLGVLDGMPELSDHKTHFVQFDYADGQYEIAARQHDGSTGLASPLTRHESTPDRMVVGRLAARMIAHDFGVVGVVQGQQGDQATVQLKGGKTQTPLDRWVRPGDVFAVALVKTAGATRGSAGQNGRGRLDPDVLLKVSEPPAADGSCRCRVFTGKDTVPNLTGARCLQLGTVNTPLRLRLVDESGATITNHQVQASDAGFQPNAPGQQTTEIREGVYTSNRAFDNAAFVRVMSGTVQVTRFPVALLDSEVVIRQVGRGTVADRLNEIVEGWRDVVASINETNQVHNGNLRQLAVLVQEKKNRQALEKAQASLDMLKAEEQNLNRRVAQLAAQSKDLPPRSRFTPPVAECEARLNDMRSGEKKLESLLTDLKNARALELSGAANPKEALLNNLNTQAKLELEQAEFEKALEIYEQILKLDANQPKVKEAADKLKADLAKRDKGAVRFAYEVWPKLRNAQEISTKIDEAKKWVKVSQTKGDRLTLEKLLLVGRTTIPNQLKDQAAGLKVAENEDDRQTAKVIQQVTQEVINLDREISAALGPAPAAVGG
jgi:hypothetical protein